MLPPPEFRCSPKQFARLLGCHVSLIYRLIAKRKVRCWRLAGTRYTLDARDAARLVEELRRAG
jgi:excisionase family DNA binding protein